MVSWFNRGLSNKFIGERIVKIAGFHRYLSPYVNYLPISRINTKVIMLPENGLSRLVNHYESSGGKDIPIILVALYNTEQLAVEIAKCLKNGTDNCCEGNDNGK